MSRLRITVATLVLLASGLFPVLGQASTELWAFYGYVSDAYGHPLEGAEVSDQYGQTAFTDQYGYYRLPEKSTGGQFTLKAKRQDTSATTKSQNVDLPVDHRVDFTLYYRISGTLSSLYLSTADGNAEATLTMTSHSPRSGSPGEAGKSCVVVTDTRTEQDSAATLASIDAVAGTSTWTFDLTVPEGSVEDRYSLDFRAIDCADGRRLSSIPVPITYIIDNTAPILTPFTHTTASDPQVIALLDDAGGSGVPSSNIEVTLDGSTLSHIRTSNGIIAPAPGTSPGPHTARIVAWDNAGNLVEESFTLIVDGEAPAVSSPSPQGIIASRTPRISATLSDDVGIDPASISLRLRGLVLESALSPLFDASTGEVSYQVPEIPSGIGTGEGPLVDGEYTVTLTVWDIAGNATTFSWTFQVSSLF